MAYIGTKPTIGNFQICDAISVVNGQAAYTMQVGSVNVIPQSANHMICSLNGVIQKPNSSFTVSGSTITFASNLATGDVIDFIQILGDVLDLGVPSDATVTESKIGSNAVTSAKMFSGFANGITMADQFKLTSAFSGNAAPIASNLSRISRTGQGTLGTGMTESSGIFTFPSTGIYHVGFTATTQLSGDNRYTFISIHATTDNSTYAVVAETISHITQNQSSTTYSVGSCDSLIDVTNTSNVKVRFHIGQQNSSTTTRGEATNATYMTFIRLGDT